MLIESIDRIRDLRIQSTAHAINRGLAPDAHPSDPSIHRITRKIQRVVLIESIDRIRDLRIQSIAHAINRGLAPDAHPSDPSIHQINPTNSENA